MAAFASCRRSGWVRLLVVILCALFIFTTLGAPPAQALGVEAVAVFGLASVLSAATAALGFKLASNEQGQATLQKMVQDFKTVAWATGFVLVGSKLNGLQNGMDYIKMQVKNGKTYLDSRVFAWVQQWLAKKGVYDEGGIAVDSDMFSEQGILNASGGASSFPIGLNRLLADGSFFVRDSATFDFSQIQSYFHLDGLPNISGSYPWDTVRWVCGWNKNNNKFCIVYSRSNSFSLNIISVNGVKCLSPSMTPQGYTTTNNGKTWNFEDYYKPDYLWTLDGSNVVNGLANFLPMVNSANDTGLSGTDTLGKDVVDLTLDQVLEKLKEWAQDWFDAGADSATNAATGALDLPLTVAAGAATANPSIAEDGPLVWFPSFGVPVPTLRTGETDTKTVDQGKENASAVETSTVDVAENQSVIDSLVNWALSYISPDTGLFSKFPLCVPYDAYLLVTSSLGVNSVGSDSIFGASPGDLDGVVSQDIETYSDFQPIINIKHDFELDGKTYPVELTIDLTPWQPFVTFFREGMALLLVAELIGSEFKRIRGH